MSQRLAAAAEEGPALHRPRGTRVYGPFPLLPSNNPGFACSAVTLLVRVPESAEHQHLRPFELFQVSDEGFRRQNVVSEGRERVRTYATGKTLREMTLDLENAHLLIGVSPLCLLSQRVGRRAAPEVCLCISSSQSVSS